MTQSNMSMPRRTASTILARADAHQVARPVRGQVRLDRFEHRLALLLRLADRQAADRVAVEADAPQACERFLPQAGEHPALHDAEQRVRILQPRELGAAALRPS